MAIVLLHLTGPNGEVRLGEEFILSLKIGRGAGPAGSSGEVSLMSGDPTYLLTPATASVEIPAGSHTAVTRVAVILVGPPVAENTVIAIDGFAEEAHSTVVTVVG